jgi:hypothetical protein
LALEVEIHKLQGEHKADKVALARERQRGQATGDTAASRATRVGQLEQAVQLSHQRAARAEKALAASRHSNQRMAAELAALHSAARAAAEAVLPAGASSDPMRLHNERVVERLFRALEHVWGAGASGPRDVAAAGSGGDGVGEGEGKEAGSDEGGGVGDAMSGLAPGAGPLDGGGLPGLTASAREQREQTQALIASYRAAAAEASVRERSVRKRALELRARLQRYGDSSADARRAVADELAELGEGGEAGGGAR